MDDLVEWLCAQLDEDERIARAAAEELGADWFYEDGYVRARRELDLVATGTQDFLEEERGEHIARHDPARVLREVEATRRLVALHARAYHQCVTEDGPTQWHAADPCTTLRLLALPYAARPGYQDSWRPE